MVWLFSQNSLKRREGINPALIEISDLALVISPIDFGIPAQGGLRTAEEQHELFLSGVSKCDGYEKISCHQSGDALDFYAYVNHHASWRHSYLTQVAAAWMEAAMILNHRIRWGGHFKPHGWDKPHIELIT